MKVTSRNWSISEGDEPFLCKDLIMPVDNKTYIIFKCSKVLYQHCIKQARVNMKVKFLTSNKILVDVVVIDVATL